MAASIIQDLRQAVSLQGYAPEKKKRYKNKYFIIFRERRKVRKHREGKKTN